MDNPAVEIITLRVDEWPLYKQIRVEAVTDSPQAFGSNREQQLVHPDSFWQKRLEDAARGESQWLLFARSAGDLVGMIGAYRDENTSQEATVISVYVTPSARGRGISALLMKAILEKLRQAGMRKVWIGVNIEQKAALHLYQKTGFQVVATEHNRMGDGEFHDEYRMAMMLE